MYAKLILFHQLLKLLPQQHNLRITYHFWYIQLQFLRHKEVMTDYENVKLCSQVHVCVLVLEETAVFIIRVSLSRQSNMMMEVTAPSKMQVHVLQNTWHHISEIGYGQGSHPIYLINKPCFRPCYVNFSTPPSPSL